MATQLIEGQYQWVQDLTGSTAANAFPSAATDGIAVPAPGRVGPKVGVMVDYTVASGTMSAVVALYGYTGNVTTPTAIVGRWAWIKSMNGGTSMAANSATWSPNASTITAAEFFEVSGDAFSRFATRVSAVGGTGVNLSTYVGFLKT